MGLSLDLVAAPTPEAVALLAELAPHRIATSLFHEEAL